VAVPSALAALLCVYLLALCSGRAERLLCAAAAAALALNAATPFITLNPPWLAALPLSLVALLGVLLLVGKAARR
jgi:hypothetical protein